MGWAVLESSRVLLASLSCDPGWSRPRVGRGSNGAGGRGELVHRARVSRLIRPLSSCATYAWIVPIRRATSACACALDECLGQRELALQRIVGAGELRILHLFGIHFLDGEALAAHSASVARRRVFSISL